MQNATLIIDNVQRSADQGTYTCIARNKHNYTSQRSVEVKVLGMYNRKCLYILHHTVYAADRLSIIFFYK